MYASLTELYDIYPLTMATSIIPTINWIPWVFFSDTSCIHCCRRQLSWRVCQLRQAWESHFLQSKAAQGLLHGLPSSQVLRRGLPEGPLQAAKKDEPGASMWHVDGDPCGIIDVVDVESLSSCFVAR